MVAMAYLAAAVLLILALKGLSSPENARRGNLFGMIGMLLWWLLIILGIVLLAKWLFSGAPGGGGRHSENRALEILRERYARGEIDRKEFEERKRDLAG